MNSIFLIFYTIFAITILNGCGLIDDDNDAEGNHNTNVSTQLSLKDERELFFKSVNSDPNKISVEDFKKKLNHFVQEFRKSNSSAPKLEIEGAAKRAVDEFEKIHSSQDAAGYEEKMIQAKKTLIEDLKDESRLINEKKEFDQAQKNLNDNYKAIIGKIRGYVENMKFQDERTIEIVENKSDYELSKFRVKLKDNTVSEHKFREGFSSLNVSGGELNIRPGFSNWYSEIIKAFKGAQDDYVARNLIIVNTKRFGRFYHAKKDRKTVANIDVEVSKHQTAKANYDSQTANAKASLKNILATLKKNLNK